MCVCVHVGVYLSMSMSVYVCACGCLFVYVYVNENVAMTTIISDISGNDEKKLIHDKICEILIKLIFNFLFDSQNFKLYRIK